MSAQKKLLQDLRQLDASSLNERLLSLKRELFLLRTSIKVGDAPAKVHLFSKIKKEIACILTVKREGVL